MATSLLPIDPQTPPQRVNRIISISANLLPEEIVNARRARRARAWVAVAVLVVAGLCAAWFMFAHQTTRDAQSELDAANGTVRELQARQADYREAAELRSRLTVVEGQLKTVMTKDLDWGALLDMLRRTGTSVEIEVTGVHGRLAGAGGAADQASAALPGTDPASAVGSLVVTGSGEDKKAVAAYADALAKQSLVTNPYVTTVTSESGGVEFSLTVDITPKALCGRFTTSCRPAGGN